MGCILSKSREGSGQANRDKSSSDRRPDTRKAAAATADDSIETNTTTTQPSNGRILMMNNSGANWCTAGGADTDEPKQRRALERRFSHHDQRPPHQHQYQGGSSSIFAMLIHGRRPIQSVKIDAYDDSASSSLSPLAANSSRPEARNAEQCTGSRRATRRKRTGSVSINQVVAGDWEPARPPLLSSPLLSSSAGQLPMPAAHRLATTTTTSKRRKSGADPMPAQQNSSLNNKSKMVADNSGSSSSKQRPSTGDVIGSTRNQDELANAGTDERPKVRSATEAGKKKNDGQEATPPTSIEQQQQQADDEVSWFANIQQLCLEIVSKGLLANRATDCEALCLFMFGCPGSSKGELAFELVEHSALTNALASGESLARAISQGCPLYHHIDAAAIIVANIDARIQQYHRLVVQTSQTRKEQLLAMQYGDENAANEHEEKEKEEVDDDDEEDDDAQSMGGLLLSGCFKEHDPSIASDISSSTLVADSRQPAPLRRSPAGAVADEFSLINLSTKDRSVLQLKLMKYFNSVTSRWVLGLIQAEIERLELKLGQLVRDTTTAAVLPKRVYLISLVPNQLSLFKSCLYLQQNLALVKGEFKYPYWAIKFERRTNIKLLSKERANEGGNSGSGSGDSSSSSSTNTKASSSSTSSLKLPSIRLSSFYGSSSGGLKSPEGSPKRRGLLGLATASSSSSGASGLACKVVAPSNSSSSSSSGGGGSGNSSLEAEQLGAMASNLIANEVNEKLGPKFNQDFAQQFQSLNKLTRVRYNPSRDYNYAQQDDDDDEMNGAAGGNASSCAAPRRAGRRQSRDHDPRRSSPVTSHESFFIGGRSGGGGNVGGELVPKHLATPNGANESSSSLSPPLSSHQLRHPVNRVLSISLQTLQTVGARDLDKHHHRQPRLSPASSGGGVFGSVGQLSPGTSSLFSGASPRAGTAAAASNEDYPDGGGDNNGANWPEESARIRARRRSSSSASASSFSSRTTNIKWAIELELFDSSSLDDANKTHASVVADVGSGATGWRGVAATAVARATTRGQPAASGETVASDGGAVAAHSSHRGATVVFHHPRAATLPTHHSKSGLLFGAATGQHADSHSAAYQLVPVRIAYANDHSQVVMEVKRVHQRRPLKPKSGGDIERLLKLVDKFKCQLVADCEGWLYEAVTKYQQQQQHHHVEPQKELGDDRGGGGGGHRDRKRHSVVGSNHTHGGSPELVSNQCGVVESHHQSQHQHYHHQLQQHHHRNQQHPALLLVVYAIRVDVSRIKSGRFQYPTNFVQPNRAYSPPVATNLRHHNQQQLYRSALKRGPNQAAPESNEPTNQLVPILTLNDRPSSNPECDGGHRADQNWASAADDAGRPASADPRGAQLRPAGSRSATRQPQRRHVQFRLEQAPNRTGADCSPLAVALQARHRHWIEDTLFVSADEPTVELMALVADLVKFFTSSTF